MKVNQIFFILLFVFPTFASQHIKKIQLDNDLSVEMKNVIFETGRMYDNFYIQDESKIKEGTNVVIYQIQKAMYQVQYSSKISTQMSQTVMNLNRSLESARQDLLGVQSTKGNARIKLLQKFSSQIISVVNAYNIDHPYKIFFCRDREFGGVWLQSETKPKNPFVPNQKCGQIMK